MDDYIKTDAITYEGKPSDAQRVIPRTPSAQLFRAAYGYAPVFFTNSTNSPTAPKNTPAISRKVKLYILPKNGPASIKYKSIQLIGLPNEYVFRNTHTGMA